MEAKQNNMEYLKEMVRTGKMTASEANVCKVEMQRVLIVRGRIDSEIRKCLNAAVKEGRLQHKKKDGAKPEVYYKSGFEYLANQERSEIARLACQAILATCCGSKA
jgi:hypothetical protein